MIKIFLGRPAICPGGADCQTDIGRVFRFGEYPGISPGSDLIPNDKTYYTLFDLHIPRQILTGGIDILKSGRGIDPGHISYARFNAISGDHDLAVHLSPPILSGNYNAFNCIFAMSFTPTTGDEVARVDSGIDSQSVPIRYRKLLYLRIYPADGCRKVRTVPAGPSILAPSIVEAIHSGRGVIARSRPTGSDALGAADRQSYSLVFFKKKRFGATSGGA